LHGILLLIGNRNKKLIFISFSMHGNRVGNYAEKAKCSKKYLIGVDILRRR